MYEVDAFWQCDSCGYSNANLDRCIMCNAWAPGFDKAAAKPAKAVKAAKTNGHSPATVETNGATAVQPEADEAELPTLSVADFRKSTYAGVNMSTKAARRANRKKATRTIWLMIFVLLISSFVAAMASAGMTPVDQVKFQLLFSVVFFGMFGLFVLARSKEMDIQPVLVLGGRGWAAAEGLVLGGGLAMVAALVLSLIVGRPTVDATVFGLAAEGGLALLLLGGLAIVVMAPLTEEFVFRGFMAETFRSRGKWVAICAAAFAFALAHQSLFMVPYYFVIGCVLGIVYFRRGLLGAITAHAAFNGMIFFMALAIVAGPPIRAELDGATVTLPGYWHIDGEECWAEGAPAPVADCPMPNYLHAVGPLGAVFDMAYEDLPTPVTASQLALPLGNSYAMFPPDYAVDQDSVGIVTLPAGDAVVLEAQIAGMDGKVAMLPRGNRIWVLGMVTISDKALDDWQDILWSWRVP